MVEFRELLRMLTLWFACTYSVGLDAYITPTVSCAGKSSILECLAAALTELGTKHVIWRMNPKAITAPQVRPSLYYAGQPRVG